MSKLLHAIQYNDLKLLKKAIELGEVVPPLIDLMNKYPFTKGYLFVKCLIENGSVWKTDDLVNLLTNKRITFEEFEDFFNIYSFDKIAEISLTRLLKRGSLEDASKFTKFIKAKGFDLPDSASFIANSVVTKDSALLFDAVKRHSIEDLKKAIQAGEDIPTLLDLLNRYFFPNKIVQCLIENGAIWTTDDFISLLSNNRITFEEFESFFNTHELGIISERRWRQLLRQSYFEDRVRFLVYAINKNYSFSDDLLIQFINAISHGEDKTIYPYIIQHCSDKNRIASAFLSRYNGSFEIDMLEIILNSGVKLPELDTLILFGNSKQTVIPSWLYQQTGLKNLNLKNTCINSIQGIENFKNLESFAFPYNLRSISKNVLEQLKNLELINVSVLLAEELLKLDFPQLKHLEIESSPQLAEQKRLFPASIEKWKNLETLEIYLNNQLKSLPIEITQLENLKYLKIKCDLEEIPQEIENLKYLEGLDLSYNELKALPKEIGQLKKLKILNLYNNKLETLPVEITQLPVLEILNVKENKKLKLPKEFGEMKSLDKDSLKTIQKHIIKDIDPNLAKIFAGQKWGVTGSFKNYKPREKALEIIESMGGLAGTSVDKTVTHLLAGEKAGEKIEKAQKLNIKIVTEAEFLELLKPGNAPKSAAKKITTLTDPSLQNKVLDAIKAVKWDVDVNYITSLLAHTISVDTKESKPQLGASKIGGKPDFPKILKWPVIADENEEGNMPLTFIAQFNMAELKPLDFNNLLPENGMLYLFMYFIVDGAQDEYASGGGDEWVKCMYYNGDMSELKPASIPKKLTDMDDDYSVGVLKESALSFKEDYTLPDGSVYSSLKDKLSEKDQEKLSILNHDTIPEITGGGTESQFLGFPGYVQGVEISGEPKEDDLPVFLQLSERLGDFGRCVADGVFYFYMNKADLLNQNFDVDAECHYT